MPSVWLESLLVNLSLDFEIATCEANPSSRAPRLTGRFIQDRGAEHMTPWEA